jgi:hypothetical protein
MKEEEAGENYTVDRLMIFTLHQIGQLLIL